jgi:hypothetical protein
MVDACHLLGLMGVMPLARQSGRFRCRRRGVAAFFGFGPVGLCRPEGLGVGRAGKKRQR